MMNLGTGNGQGGATPLRGALTDGRTEIPIREIPIDRIERDANQPRQHFDQAELQSLADSMGEDGLLQEPAVEPCAEEGGRITRYRLLFGERRWRAAQLLGWKTLRCKVVPRGDPGAAAEVRRVEKQWKENAERVDLSPLEEGRAIQLKVAALRAQHPDVAEGALIDRVAEERGLHHSTARTLVSLLDGPKTLQEALLRKQLSREVAFELLWFWNRLEKESDYGKAERAVRYHEALKTWLAQHGLEENADGLRKYADETFQDLEVVRKTCRVAAAALEEKFGAFESLLARVVKKGLTLAEVRRLVKPSRRRGGASDAEAGTQLVHSSGAKGAARLTVFLGRMREAGPEALGALREALVALDKAREEVSARCAALAAAETAARGAQPGPAK